MMTEPAHYLDTSSWTRRDLGPFLNGQGVPPPAILTLDNGHCLFYRGRLNGLHGEPEGGKSWLGFVANAQILLSGGRCLYLDYEDDETGVVERLRALGVPDSLINGPTFYYLRPEESLQGQALADLNLLLAGPMFDLVTLDSMNEGMVLESLDPSSNMDAGVFSRRLIRRFLRTGACVLVHDHVPKNRDSRGDWQIGAQQKRAIIRGASYRVENKARFGRGITGVSELFVAKDTPGHIRSGIGLGGMVARFTLASDLLTGKAAYELAVPMSSLQVTVDRMLAYVRVNPGASKRALRSLGNSDTVDKALADAVENGLIRVERMGTLHAHFLSLEA